MVSWHSARRRRRGTTAAPAPATHGETLREREGRQRHELNRSPYSSSGAPTPYLANGGFRRPHGGRGTQRDDGEEAPPPRPLRPRTERPCGSARGGNDTN